MRKLCFSLLLVLASVAAARADEIVFFNFNNDSLAASRGTGTLTTTNNSTTYFAGTVIGAQQPSDNPPGDNVSLALRNGTNNVNNGSNLTLQLSTVGFNSISVSFATQRSGDTAFRSNQFQYSLDGTTFVNFGSTFDPPTSFALQSFDLSSIAALNDRASVFFRIVFGGATGTTSTANNRVDNLGVFGTRNAQAAPVPEPASMMLLGTGLAGAVAAVRRRRRVV